MFKEQLFFSIHTDFVHLHTNVHDDVKRTALVRGKICVLEVNVIFLDENTTRGWSVYTRKIWRKTSGRNLIGNKKRNILYCFRKGAHIKHGITSNMDKDIQIGDQNLTQNSKITDNLSCKEAKPCIENQHGNRNR